MCLLLLGRRKSEAGGALPGGTGGGFLLGPFGTGFRAGDAIFFGT